MAISLHPALEQSLVDLAAQTHQSPDALAHEALEGFVAYRRDLNEAVKRGDEAIVAGDVIDHEELFAEINRMLSEA